MMTTMRAMLLVLLSAAPAAAVFDTLGLSESLAVQVRGEKETTLTLSWQSHDLVLC